MPRYAPPPLVYHMAEAANWESIQRYGLLSASALLARAALPHARHEELEAGWRPAHTRLPTGVEIRDQRPMPPNALARCLADMTPAEWYRLVNSRVFFWFDYRRMSRQRAACPERAQVVLMVDRNRLIARYSERIALTPINTGNARRRPALRGRATFVPYPSWAASRWASEAAGLGRKPRPRSHAPVELTVLDAVPDIADFVVHVVHLRPGRVFCVNVVSVIPTQTRH